MPRHPSIDGLLSTINSSPIVERKVEGIIFGVVTVQVPQKGPLRHIQFYNQEELDEAMKEGYGGSGRVIGMKIRVRQRVKVEE